MVEQWPGDSPAAWIDDIGHAIAERYRSIEDALLESLQRHYAQHLEAPDDLISRYRTIQELREQAQNLVNTVPPEALARLATEQAALGASAEISRMLMGFPAYGARGVAQVTSLTQGGALAVAAVELDLRDALRALNERILRAPADAYQAMTSKHIGSLLTGMTTSQALHRRILDEYLADGITGFIDKSNRRWTIGAYSEMATRTAAHRAWGDQARVSMEAHGITTFTPVIGNSACANCGQWEGKILTDGGPTGDVVVAHAITAEPTTIRVDATLADWRASKAGHPNCRCVMVPGLPGGPDPTKYSTWDKQKEADRKKLRELEREVREAKRNGTPEDIGDAQAKLREHVQETGVTRRDFREQLPFADGGDKNPRGRTRSNLGAGRHAKPGPTNGSGDGQRVKKALQELIPGVNVQGIELIIPERLDQAMGYLRPFESLLAKYPALKVIPEIAFVNMPARSATAWVTSIERLHVKRLTFNLAMDLTPDVMRKTIEHGWFRALPGTNGRTYAITHELGHVADFSNGQTPSKEAMRILREMADPGGTLKTDSGLLRRAHAMGLISEYASKSVYEMVAEAFATVETSASIATAAEKAVHAAIVRALRGG